ncbi:MAG: hypothetical protein M1812_003927 [Candelaria pacifica]|nr:MAG: hypothetical protein M1812_003927 [Candelaria pacifica]
MARTCIIIGGGVAGPATALALSRTGIHCSIYELRDEPSTIGGAINLTPNALRLLQDLDVEVSGCVVESIELFSIHTAQKLGEIPFGKEKGHARRILRKDLQQALLDALSKKGISVVYGSKLASVIDDSSKDKITATFANGTSVEANFIVGCDGTHSAVRLQCVEPDRKPEYTGVATAYAIIDTSAIKSKIHFQQTAVNMSQRGSLMTSYIDPEHAKLYLAAVMETKEQASKEGWRALGQDNESTLREINRRYRDTVLPCLPEMIDQVDNFFYYPVYKLGPFGKWSSGRVLLLGDAAHAMPPQGESIGLAIEDAVLLSRVLQKSPERSIPDSFSSYEKTRQPRIDAAYKEATSRWEKVKDRTWLQHRMVEWFTWAYLWYKWSTFESSHAYEVRNEAILE